MRDNKMNEQQAKQFIENWVKESKYTVSCNRYDNSSVYKTKAEAFADVDFTTFNADSFDIPRNTERGDFYAEIEIRVFNKIAKKDYEEIIDCLIDDNKDRAIELLGSAEFTDSTRLVTKGSYIPGAYYGTRFLLDGEPEYVYFSPLPGDTLNIVGRVISPDSEIPAEVKEKFEQHKSYDYDFDFVMPEFNNDEEIGNIITGKIDEHLGGSCSYEYEVYINKQKVGISE
jgi:plasmid stabilization system protein ParE